MKTNFILLLLISFCISVTSTNSLKAQEISTENKASLSFETDPSTFAFGGYAFHFRFKPGKSRHLVRGAGTYALDFPDFLVNMNPDNRNNDWNVRINSAYSLFGEYYFTEANRQWFLGLQTGIQNYKNSNNLIENKQSKYSNLLLMPSMGYNWQPFSFPFYLKPWAGLGYTSKISGNNSIDELTYIISPIIPFVTLHIGYTFK